MLRQVQENEKVEGLKNARENETYQTLKKRYKKMVEGIEEEKIS